MEFNKLDICAAYYLYGSMYHTGQGSKEYAYMGRAVNAGFKPGYSFSFASLSDNAKEIYHNLVGQTSFVH